MKAPPPALPPLFASPGTPPSPSAIDPSFLDPEDANILSFLANSSSKCLASKIEAQLKTVQEKMEFQVDQFADGAHKLDQACQTLDSVASRVLALSAARLDEREKKERDEVGMRDHPIQEVLRTLSRIIPSDGN